MLQPAPRFELTRIFGGTIAGIALNTAIVLGIAHAVGATEARRSLAESCIRIYSERTRSFSAQSLKRGLGILLHTEDPDVRPLPHINSSKPQNK
jgi:hypothetical protein